MMKNKLVAYLSKYTEISEELEKRILESVLIKEYPKGTLLLKKGDLSGECYFILKGCIRGFYVQDDEEKTFEFYTEEQVVTPPCYGKNIPSEINLECVEDTIAGVGTPDMEAKAYQNHPQLEPISRSVNGMLMANLQEAHLSFKMMNPEQRYLNLLKTRPDLLQRVPQHQIASYLGIKPESLSRIRKRLVKK